MNNYPLLLLLTPLQGNKKTSEDLRNNFFRTLSAMGFEIDIGSNGTFKFTRKVIDSLKVTENRSIVIKVEGGLVFLFIAKTISPLTTLKSCGVNERTKLLEVEHFPLEVKENIFFAKIKTLESLISKKLCK